MIIANWGMFENAKISLNYANLEPKMKRVYKTTTNNSQYVIKIQTL